MSLATVGTLDHLCLAKYIVAPCLAVWVVSACSSVMRSIVVVCAVGESHSYDDDLILTS